MKLRRILLVALLGLSIAGCWTRRHDDGVDGLGLAIGLREVMQNR